MMKLFRYLIPVLLLLACTPQARRPKFVPDQEKMSLLLADVYEVEAAISQSGRHVNRNDDKYFGYYKDVLENHSITKFEFDSAISWYSAHPKLFAEVYDEVISILSQRDALMKKDVAEQNQEVKDMIDQIPDMKDYWETERNYALPLTERDSADITFPFYVMLDSIKSGIVRLNASYKFNKGNELDSAQLKMILCYADSTRDTMKYQIKKSFKKSFGNVSQLIPEGKSLISVEGWLFEHDTSKVAHVEIGDVKLTLIPKLSTSVAR